MPSGSASPRPIGSSSGAAAAASAARSIATSCACATLSSPAATFRDVPAAIDPGETASDLNLGTSILRHFIITTDFAERAIWLEPRE